MDIYVLCDYEIVDGKRRRILVSFENGQLNIFARQLIDSIWVDFDSDYHAIQVELEIFAELNKSLLKVKNKRVTANSFAFLKQVFLERLTRLFKKTNNRMLRGARIIDSPLEADY